MKNFKFVIFAVLSVILWVGTAGPVAAQFKNDFKLGQNTELTVNMLRGLYTYYVDDVDVDRLGKNAAKGMVEGLDPYTTLIHADDMPTFELMTTGKYGGIGSVIRQSGDFVIIAEPYEGAPADKAGLEIGDVILEIGGKSADGMTTAEVSKALKGEAGTRVKVKVKKLYSGKDQSLTIRREVIALPAVPFFGMVADSIGYIRHSDFTDGSAGELRKTLMELKSLGAKQLVLDYRNNGGGILQEAVDIVSLFVPRGTEVVRMKGRGRGEQIYRTKTEPVDTTIPIVVLVDRHSASAAEIVAGALQDLDRAVIVGQRTFGKGLVQSTIPVGFNSYLKVTTAKYYTPSGRCIQAIDYSSHPEDDTVSHTPRAIPDSLIKEFRTAGGRKVYDGGGIMPDVRLEPDTTQNFVYTIYARGFVDDFADAWSAANQAREVISRTFVLTEDDWTTFTEFMATKELDYRSLTARSLEILRESAAAERYMNPELEGYLNKIAAATAFDTATELARYRTEIQPLIENAIVLRRHRMKGVSERSLTTDKDVAAATRLLADEARYIKILISKDTEKQ